jgi:2-keto-4-pentenoate hydratase
MSDLTDTTAIETTAQILWDAWTDGELIDGLPAGTGPANVADAYRVQFATDRFAGARVGWKLAATGAGGRTALGVDQPLAGPLYARFQVPVGGSVEFGALRMSTIEAEFGLRLGRDLPATGAPYDHDTVRAAIDAFVPAIEFPNTRYLDHRSAGVVALTADAALAGFFVLGEPLTDFDIDSLPEHTVVLNTPNGPIEGTGAKVLGDPVEAVRWLANELGTYGYGLKAGETVITGAAAATREPGAGRVWAEYGTLGQVELQLT